VEIQEHRSTEELGEDRGEDEPVGEGVHLDQVVTTAEMQVRRDERCGDLEGQKLKEIAKKASTPAGDRQAVHGQRAVALNTRLPGLCCADQIHLVAREEESPDLTVHP
jgi:hypothetical protein